VSIRCAAYVALVDSSSLMLVKRLWLTVLVPLAISL
jgi:hypothetical protein